MAKKKQSGTVEELLEQALVQESEQPYEVPENWVWTFFRSICAGFQYGYTDKATYDEVGPKFIRITDISGGNVDFNTAPYCITTESDLNKYRLYKNDILIARMGSVGENGVVAEDSYAVFASYLIRLKPLINAKYLKYILQSDLYWRQIFSNKKGTTRANINANNLREMLCPLPPLAEQQRIVDRFESLFEKLDQAKGLIQNALDSFENRKAAILHKAFSGELTKKWRKENGVGMESWESVALLDVIEGFKYGTSEKSDYSNQGIPVIRIPNVISNTIDFCELKYLKVNTVDVLQQIVEDDLLVIRSNGSRDLVGKCALVPKLDRAFTYASYLIRVRPNRRVIPQYLLQVLNSSNARFQMFSKSKSSAGINNINTKELGSIKFELPTISEQLEIVRILNSLLDKEEKINEAISLAESLEGMKKGIIASAFRGELGTNDPFEESALELLKKVIAMAN